MTVIRPEQFEEFRNEVEQLAARTFSETEVEEVRLLLRRWRRIHVFLDGLGWLGRNLARLAVWIAAIWGAVEIVMRVRS